MAKKKEKNSDFVQIYRPFMDDITNMACKNKQAFRLLMLLLHEMDGTNALCASYSVLTEMLRVSQSTLKRSISYLHSQGWIDILKSGGTNVYIVNPNVAWTSYKDQKKYCRFNANVLVSHSENPDHAIPEAGTLDTRCLSDKKATDHFKHIDESFIAAIRKKRLEEEEFQMKLENGEVEWDDQDDVEQLPLEHTELS